MKFLFISIRIFFLICLMCIFIPAVKAFVNDINSNKREENLSSLLTVLSKTDSVQAIVIPTTTVAKTFGSFTVKCIIKTDSMAIGGGIKVRFFKGFGKPQNVNPNSNNYVTASTSNPKSSVKITQIIKTDTLVPWDWDRFVYVVTVKVEKNKLKYNDTINLIYGVPPNGLIGNSFSAFTDSIDIAYDLKGNRKYYEISNKPTLTITGNQPYRITAYLPSTVSVNLIAKLKIVIVDQYNNLSNPFPYTINISSTDPSAIFSSVLNIQPSDSCKISTDIIFKTPGTHTVQVSVSEKSTDTLWKITTNLDTLWEVTTNPVKVFGSTDHDNLYWGDLHSHSEISHDGNGTNSFWYAKEVACLDFYALTDHTNNPDNNGPGGINPKEWTFIKKSVINHHKPYQFVTLLAYELSYGAPSGHHNIFFNTPDSTLLTMPLLRENKYRNINAVWDQKKSLLKNYTFFTVPHHTGIQWTHKGGPLVSFGGTYSDSVLRPLVEIYSSHGLSEKYDPLHNLSYDKIYNLENASSTGPHYAQDAWASGEKLGVIASSDDHNSKPGMNYNGLTAVYTKNLTRDEIFNALKNRNSYGTTGRRIILDFKINNAKMGSTIDYDTLNFPTISFDIHATGYIDKVEILRFQGEYHGNHPQFDIIYSEKNPGMSLSRSIQDCTLTDVYSKKYIYYLRIKEQIPIFDVGRKIYRESWAWSSPIWINAKYLTEEVYESSMVFGQHFFKNKKISSFQKTTDIKAPDNYILGKGDKVNVSVWGFSDYNQIFEIDDEGVIKPDKIGKIYLKGLPFIIAKDLLINKFSSIINLTDSKIDITLAYSRVITVNLIGEVERPGSYSIPAINTPFNALMVANGTNTIGSLRQIYIKRNDVLVKTLDVYEFLLNPTGKEDFFIEDNDYFIVPPRARVVKISGKIKRPHSYELIEKENLVALINYAGGLDPSAYTHNIQIERFNEKKEKIIIDINLDSLKKTNSDFVLLNGDKINIPVIPSFIKNSVNIEGAVKLPGTYQLSKGDKIHTIIERAAGVLIDTYFERAFLIRLQSNHSKKYIPFNLKKVLENKNSNDNIELQEFDIIKIFSQAEFRDLDYVSIFGAIRKPGKFLYTKNLTLRDLIYTAGGFTDDAYLIVGYITRLNSDSTFTHIPFQADTNAYMKALDTILLRRKDEIKIFSKTLFEDVNSISVTGLVRYPGKLIYAKGMTLEDALYLSGGLRMEAANHNIEISRSKYLAEDTTGTVKHDNKEKIIILKAQVHKDMKLDTLAKKFLLIPYDNISVRLNPDLELPGEINVKGEVKFPGLYIIKSPSERVSDIIFRSGGLTELAFKQGATLYRSEADKIISFSDTLTDSSEVLSRSDEGVGFLSIDLEKILKNKNSEINYVLKPGDLIIVPKKSELIEIAGAIEYPGIDSTKTLFAPYKEGKRANYYINNFGFGFNKNANKNKTFVRYPDGIYKQTFSFGLWNIYPKVPLGSVIVATYKQPKGSDKNPLELRTKNLYISPQLTTAGTLDKFEIKYFLPNDIQPGVIIKIQMPGYWGIPQGYDSSKVNYVYAYSNRYGKKNVFKIDSMRRDNFVYFRNSKSYTVSFRTKVPFFKDDLITLCLGGTKGYEVNIFSGIDTFYVAQDYTIKGNQQARNYSQIDFFTLLKKPKTVYRLLAYSPSNPVYNEPFKITVMAMDDFLNPAYDYRGTIAFENMDGTMLLPNTYSFTENDSGLHHFEIKIEDKDVHRIKVKDDQNRETVINPIVCKEKNELKIWWGDLHNHSIYSGHGYGSVHELLDYAKKFAKLDFFAYTEHIDLSPHYFYYSIELVNKFNKDNEFVAFNGYEWNELPPKYINHKCVYFAGDSINYLYRGYNSKELYNLVKKNNGLVHFAHPGAKSMHCSWEDHDAEVQRNVEIVGLGNVIYDKPMPHLPEFSSVFDALSYGYEFGFLGASDCHSPRPGRILPSMYKPERYKESAKTATFSENLNRKEVFNAIKKRNNYATTGARIILNFSVNDILMGKECMISEKYPEIKLEAHGTDIITQVEIIKNNFTIYSFNPEAIDVKVTFTDSLYEINSFYFCKITQKDKQYAWASPVWCVGAIPKTVISDYSPLITVAPGYSKKQFYIHFGFNVNNKTIFVRILDIMLNPVKKTLLLPQYKTNVGGNHIEWLDLSELNPGLYFIEIIIDKQKITKKINIGPSD